MRSENEKTEFKRQFTNEIYKEVIAFANTEGGCIYVGVDDEGNAVGMENVDEELLRITNGIRDSVVPDVTVFTQYTITDDRVIRISVSEGTGKPYCLRSKGLRPGGVFVRQGTSSAPASYDRIRRMIKESDGDIFEEMRSLQQELSFEYASGVFKRSGVEFSPAKYSALGITHSGDALYTDLGLLLSDQCPYTIKTAVFDDAAKTVFKDRREFKGSVFKQMDDCFEFLGFCNRTASQIKGLLRLDKKDYPEEALREALLNAIMHRDYSFSGSIIINISESEAEFISLGGLMHGLSAEDIMNGISQPRNKNLTEVFHRLGLAEAYGTGIRRIFDLYSSCSVKPKIEVTQHTFKITLPNMNHASEQNKIDDHDVYRDAIKPTDQMKRVMEHIKEYGSITDDEMSDLLEIKRTRTYLLAREMKEKGFIEAKGRGKDKYYYIPR